VTAPKWARKRTRAGRRSKFEDSIAESLARRGCSAEYENVRLAYVDTRKTTYTPDFHLPNGIHVEAKGYFTSADRAKHLLVRDQHPYLDIRFVFSNPNTKLSKDSKTTYAGWCVKHAFKYAAKDVPDEWLKETK
jgi:hypothetical protein